MIQRDKGFLGFPFLFSSQAFMKGNGSKRRRVFFRVLGKWFIYGFFYLDMKMVFWESSLTAACEAHMDASLSNSS